MAPPGLSALPCSDTLRQKISGFGLAKLIYHGTNPTHLTGAKGDVIYQDYYDISWRSTFVSSLVSQPDIPVF